jgi:hypothetical protein
MVKEMIKWRPIIIGIIIVIALYIVSTFISGQNTALTDFFLAGIAVGFMVGGTIRDGALNSLIFGVIGGIIITLILLVVYSLSGFGSMIGLILASQLTPLVLEIVMAVIGGVVGYLINAESKKYNSPEVTKE